mgnify:CR=1 FL=1
MNKPNAYINDDYAGLIAKNASFYYGYEQTHCKVCKKMNCQDGDHDNDREWCFVANIGDKEIIIPDSKLKSEEDSMESKLLTGIGWILAKYKFSEVEA